MTLTHNHSIGCLNRQKCQWWYCYRLLKISVNGATSVFVGALWATQQQTVLHCSEIMFSIVSRFSTSLYTTSHICMQCLTGLSIIYNASFNIATRCQKWSSMEHQWSLVLPLGQFAGCLTVLTHNWYIGRLYGQKCWGQFRYRLLWQSIDRASTVLVGARLRIQHSTELHYA